MTEEIQETEKLIKQSAELGDSLIRLARKLQEQSKKQVRVDEERWDNLRALDNTLTDLRSYIEVAKREIGPYRHYGQDEAYPKAHVAVLGGTATPPEAAIELLRAGVASKTITADAAAEQLAKLLDLPASRRIQICQSVKAAFEAGDDVVGKVRPYLKRSTQVTEQHARKTIAVTSDV
jgi:NADPH-dependent glutamate synthase beta subunit-like oxidoreductase